jgi:hypothetical protein
LKGIYAELNKPGVAPNTLDVSFTIPTSQASGEYHLDAIRAMVADPNFTLYYRGGEIPARTFRIANPATLVKPTIKDVKVLP